jgi:hypothetical protein
MLIYNDKCYINHKSLLPNPTSPPSCEEIGVMSRIMRKNKIVSFIFIFIALLTYIINAHIYKTKLSLTSRNKQTILKNIKPIK